MAVDIGTGDPNAAITDPTGGAPNFNILDVFHEMGYYPTQTEINAIAPAFEGRTDPGQIGTAAVSQYVLAKQSEATRVANDPLAALQTKMQESADTMKQQVQGLYTQLQGVLTEAPQLFGSLTPDQITTYLAPLQTAFKTQLATVQGALAGRGLGGSSTESNALAQTGEQFQEQVLSTGLNVGIQSQQARAKAMSDQINSLLGLTGTEESLASSAAQTRSQQQLGQSNLISSLPYFLDQSALQQEAARKAMQPQGGFQSTFNQVTGDISQGVNALESLGGIPQQFKTAPGGSTAPNYPTPGVNAPNTPFNPFASQASFGPGGVNAAPPNLDLFAAP
jgi:hypothetical protein